MPSNAAATGVRDAPPLPMESRRQPICGALQDEIDSLCSELLDRYEEASLVHRLTERLSTVLGEAEISRLVLEEASQVLGAHSAALWLSAGSDTVLAAQVVVRGQASPGAPEAEVLQVLDSGRPWLREGSDALDPVVAVPLPDLDERPLGVLVLRGRTENRPYRTGSVKTLTALATLAASFIRNDRLAQEARRAAARQREDEISRQIHRGLLPSADPEFDGLDIAGICLAADNIGGDYYGYMPLDGGCLGVALADVTGHGVGAALYMASAKSALQFEAGQAGSPGDLLGRTNRALAADFGEAGLFATAFFARFAPGGRRIDYSNGGHKPPVLVRQDGTVDRLHAGGVALGVIEDLVFEDRTATLDQGDCLVLYTDGLTETRDARRRFYSRERLERKVRDLRTRDAKTIRDRIVEDLRQHCGESAIQDDVTLVVVRAVAQRRSC